MYSREELDPSFGPYEVNIGIGTVVLEDGCKISTKFWFPGADLPAIAEWSKYCEAKDSNKNESKFPTIMEYLPYCKTTWTSPRDHLRHPWMASHGYVVIRPDMRGTGDSEGLCFDEYELQEQEDACQIIGWIAKQSWSNGAVGMFGKSWGGFNGLQVAFKQPPALKGVVSLYSTDNRFTDDVHWKGGSLVASQMLSWASVMFAWNARPPHHKYFAGGQDWKKAWKERLEKAGHPWTKTWLEHQTYDKYWENGSICEDYGKVSIPVLAIGGWHDMYSNAVFRMVDKMPNCRGIIGPWSHDWPDVAIPGPQIGFLDECLDFWNFTLKGVKSEKQEKAPKMIWYQCFGKVPPVPIVPEWPGEWCSKPFAKPDLLFKYFLNEGHLLDQQDFCGPKKEWDLEYDANAGWTAGEMLSFGGPDLPGEQSFFNDPKTTWKSQRLQRELDLFGFPEFSFQFLIHNDTQASLIVKLCDEFPDGQTRLISFGAKNLTHAHLLEKPRQLRTGTWFDATIQLDALGYRMLHGHKIVMHVTCSYWPMIWTPRRCTNMAIRAAHLSLPILENLGSYIDRSILCTKPHLGPPLKVDQLSEPSYNRRLIWGLSSSKKSIEVDEDDGLKHLVDEDVIMGETSNSSYELDGNQNPLTAKAEIKHNLRLDYVCSEKPIKTEITTISKMTCDMDSFHLDESIKVTLDGEVFFEKSHVNSVPRIFS